jgi:hypothetical protein
MHFYGSHCSANFRDNDSAVMGIEQSAIGVGDEAPTRRLQAVDDWEDFLEWFWS